MSGDIELAEWKGRVDGKLTAVDETLGGFGQSLDRIESKVNAIKNENSESRGGFKVGIWVGGVMASGVMIVFAAFVTKVFT